MCHVLRGDLDIPDLAGVAIEYIIPQSQKRIDFILSGKDEKQNNQAVVIELKQWNTAEKVEGKENVVRTVLGGSKREVTHPSYQAWSYCYLLENYNSEVQDNNINFHPCAYLHNYDESVQNELRSECYAPILEESPMFTCGQMNLLRDYIKSYISYPDDMGILETIEHGKLRPSKALQDCILAMLEGKPEFVLIDEQKVIFENIVKAALDCIHRRRKGVYIVRGGPGTGKSVIAINLLVKFIAKEIMSQYITKTTAPREVYRAMLKKGFKQKEIDALFTSSGTFYSREANELPIAIVDEAHRLTEKSGMYGNLGEDQIKEVIHSSLFSVFFIDEKQKVTSKDAGSIDKIRHFACEEDAYIYEGLLEAQFRCNGSDEYLIWLDNLLMISSSNKYDNFKSDYDFRVYSNPNELKAAIERKNKENNKSRIVAGYCWEWPKVGRNNPNIKDIQIPEYNFGMSWNLSSSSTYAIDPDSVHEAGCIHTTQGLEFEYVGVIIGDDLRYENGQIITDITKRAKTDASIKGLKTLIKENPDKGLAIADEIVKNTYRTLMTRGQKGCFVYCTNKALEEYIKSKLHKENICYSEDFRDLLLEVSEESI